MSDVRRYRVSMALPISFDVDAESETDAKNKVRHIVFRPYSSSVLTPVDQVVANYAIGAYSMDIARVEGEQQ